MKPAVTKPAAALGLLATVGLLLACAPVSAAAAVSPLPATDYTVHPACQPPAAGHASCLALRLVPETAAARAHTHPLGMTRSGSPTPLSAAEGGYGFTPANLRDAYFPGEEPRASESTPQTIALVDAYNDPEAEADLAKFSEEFGLPKLEKCASKAAGDCFEQVNQNGETTNLPFPESELAREDELAVCENTGYPKDIREKACSEVVEADGWALEISTDIEVAHGICQNCKVVLVEASSTAYASFDAAEETAAKDATEVSNSWGGGEAGSDSSFDHPGTVITASAGDDGYLNWTGAAEAEANEEQHNVEANYPASSPHVIAVGGTRLTLRSDAWQSESVWNDDPRGGDENHGAGGSGCSLYFEAAPWQQAVPDWSSVGCEDRRAVADVSADGDPYTGVAVYDSVPYIREEDHTVVNTPLYWLPVGGTSVASPIIASMFALAGGANGVAYPAETIYSHLETGLLHPVTAGGNGECDALYSSGCSGSMNPLSSRFAFDCGEGVLICNAAEGCAGLLYSGPAGVGTPNGVGAFKPEEHPAKDVAACPTKNESEPKNESKPETKAGPASTGATTAPKTDAATTPKGPVLSGLSLTFNAIVALNRHRPKVSRVGFAFKLSAAARVKVTLARRVRVHRHARWRVVSRPFELSARHGHDSGHFKGKHTLVKGLYRLTLAPAHGQAKSILFSIG